MAAHLARVDLSAHGFYSTPDITGFGGDRPFSYFTYGAAASEVELDTLSGDFQARRKTIMSHGQRFGTCLQCGEGFGGDC